MLPLSSPTKQCVSWCCRKQRLRACLLPVPLTRFFTSAQSSDSYGNSRITSILCYMRSSVISIPHQPISLFFCGFCVLSPSSLIVFVNEHEKRKNAPTEDQPLPKENQIPFSIFQHQTDQDAYLFLSIHSMHPSSQQTPHKFTIF